MSALTRLTSIRSPWVAVIGGPGTWPLKVQAATRPAGVSTVAVRAVSVNRRTAPPGAGVSGPRRSVTTVTGPGPGPVPPPESIVDGGTRARAAPMRRAVNAAT